MSFKDLKPEYKQKLQHILDEFAAATQENELLKTQLIKCQQKYKQEILLLKKENKQILQQLNQKGKVIDNLNQQLGEQQQQKFQPQKTRQTNIQNNQVGLNQQVPEDDSSYQYLKVQKELSPSLLYNSTAQPEDIILKSIQSRIKQILPSTELLQDKQEEVLHKNNSQQSQISQPTIFSIRPQHNFIAEDITQEIKSCLPDLKYFESRMNSLQYVSFSDEVTPQSNQIYLRQEQENVTSIPQINQSVQYSMIQPQYLNNTVNYDVVNIKKNQKRNQNLDLDIIIQKNTTLQSNHSKPLESIGITELDTNIMNNFDSSQQIENFKKQSQTQRFNQFNQTNAFANMYQSEKKKNQFKDISSHEESLPSPDTPVQLKADDLQTTKIQTTQRFQESELSLKKEERQQIMNQSLIKFQEAKKAIVNKNKFSSSISPQFDESFLLKVSSARVLEDEIYHQKIDQDLIQKQKIRSSLTQMEEDELDGLIQLLNSGN